MLLSFFQSIVRRRGIVLLLISIFVFLCIGAARHLPVDVVPDISPVLVQILAPTPMLPPEQAELAVTRPIELEMMGLPGLSEVRSLTRFGICQISLIFEDGTDPYRARQIASERLPNLVASLPPGITPRLAPMSTGLGEIYTYALVYRPGADAPKDEKDRLAELKSIQDFTVRPVLRQVSGLAEVNTTGGYGRELVVEVDPGNAASQSFDLDDIALAVRRASEIGSGSFINDGQQQLILRADARMQTPEQLGGLMLKMGWSDAPATLGEIAHIAYGVKPRTGAATLNGEEAVLGTAMMLPGENSRQVSQHVREKLAEVARSLPPNVEIQTLYDRSILVNETLHTVRTNLAIGAALVVLVLFLFFGNLRAAFMVAAVLPLAFLVGLGLMAIAGVPGNLMSLGAIDFGLLIDGAVVLMDNILLHLGRRQTAVERPLTRNERLETIARASAEMAVPMICGILIIALVYLPVFGLNGVQLKMFSPMALTVIFCLLGSLLLAVTMTPALASFGFGHRVRESDTALVNGLKNLYRPALLAACRHPWAVIGTALVLVAGSTLLFLRLGAEFVPTLDEGSLVIEIVRKSGINLDASVEMEKASERAILKDFPEVAQVFARIGYSDITTDAQSPGENDIYIGTKPQSEWRVVDGHRLTKEQLADKIQGALNQAVPGQEMNRSQPIEVRLDELLEGVKADLAVKIFGQDYDTLVQLGNQVKERLLKLPGADDVHLEAMGRTDVLEAKPVANAGPGLGMAPSDFNRVISESVLGVEAGRVDEGDRFYPIVVRLPEKQRQDIERIKIAPVRSTIASIMANLRGTATFERVPRLTGILREGGERRVAVLITLHGRDVLGFVQQARQSLAEMKLPPGFRFELGGSFQNYERAKSQLTWIIPPVLALIFGLALLSLGSVRQAFLVLTAIPLSAVGGVVALWLTGLPFSITAAVGIIAVGGIAVLNCLVKIAYINQLREAGYGTLEAVTVGALRRLRPVLTTALVASLGFVPMALATGLGAEVQRPLAIVVIGGVLSSSILTLFVTPILYLWMESEKARPTKSIKLRQPMGEPASRSF